MIPRARGKWPTLGKILTSKIVLPHVIEKWWNFFPDSDCFQSSISSNFFPIYVFKHFFIIQMASSPPCPQTFSTIWMTFSLSSPQTFSTIQMASSPPFLFFPLFRWLPVLHVLKLFPLFWWLSVFHVLQLFSLFRWLPVLHVLKLFLNYNFNIHSL